MAIFLKGRDFPIIENRKFDGRPPPVWSVAEMPEFPVMAMDDDALPEIAAIRHDCVRQPSDIWTSLGLEIYVEEGAEDAARRWLTKEVERMAAGLPPKHWRPGKQRRT
jgi:hypothetical protein